MENNEMPLMAKVSLSSRIFKKKMKVLCEKKGINSTYFKIILAISKCDDVNQLDIVNETRLSAPTVSITLKKMEEEGLIKRETKQEDQRNVIVSFTEAGKKVDDDIRELFAELEKEIASLFTKEDLAILFKGLDRINDYLEDRQ